MNANIGSNEISDGDAKKINLKTLLPFHIAVAALVLRLSFHVHGYVILTLCLMPGILLSAAYFLRKSLWPRYTLSGAALAVITYLMIALHYGAGDIFYFVLIVPAIYTYLLPDRVSPFLAGILLAFLIVRSGRGYLPEKVFISMAAGAAFSGILLAVIGHLMRGLIEERDRYKEISAGLQQANDELKYGILHDSLTGLPNRNYIANELTNAIKKKREIGSYSFAIAFLDLDRFKVVNDSLGHNYGDKLLIEVSKRLQSCLRSCDSVARLGGDEFVIFLSDIKGVHDAERIIERVLSELKKPFIVMGREINTSASIGIVMSNNQYDMPGEYLRYADITMYRAKTLGKSRYEIFDSSTSQNAIKNLRLESDLRFAIERQELKLVYQPIYSLLTRDITGFEALIRWNHPELGMIPPMDFIPLAEETGLIVPIGKWVLYEACRQVNEWQRSIGRKLPIAINVNLSPIQLTQLEIASDVGEIIRNTGIDPNNLHIEITESALIKDIETSQYALEQIKSLGVGIYIDDFGTGYSSLSYLNQFPFDAIKIDRSFMQQLRNNSGLLKNIIHMAHELNMGVIGEGIESQDQAKRLNEFGCECGQGFYFSKPADIQTVEKMLKDYAERLEPQSSGNKIILA
jgi:diguanylate cyclase (GGDEF) domain